jgi:hypothetical protein
MRMFQVVLVPRTKTIQLRESCIKQGITPHVLNVFGPFVSWGRDIRLGAFQLVSGTHPASYPVGTKTEA